MTTATATKLDAFKAAIISNILANIDADYSDICELAGEELDLEEEELEALKEELIDNNIVVSFQS